MKFIAGLAFSVALASSVAAQNVAIPAIEAHFTQSRIVPDLLASFKPTALLNITYEGVGTIAPGQKFAKELVNDAPTEVRIFSSNTSATFTGTYTIAMLDAEIPGAQLPNGQNRHWLLNGVTFTNGVLSTANAVGITPYAGPWPAAASGPHRYVVLVYEQPSTFAAPEAFSRTGLGVEPMNWTKYVTDSKLGALIAGNYINVEEGTSTVSFAPTSAVDSATLSAASAPTTGTGTTATTGKPSTNTSAGSPASAPTGAASSVKAGVQFIALSAAMTYFFL